MLAADVNVLTRQPRVAVLTLGCKVNHAESDELVDQFTAAGFVPTAFEEDADVYVVNTCSVTHVGDAKSRQAIRQATRRNPSALVVATGCFATTAAHRFPIEDVLVVKNRDKDRLIDIVRTHLGVGDDHPIPFKAVELGLAPAQARHTRAMIKVQDGCDSACSYCIIPRARGRSRSTPLDHCIERTRTLVAAGHKEVVITGVDLGSYGLDLPEPTDLAHLITRMLNETDIHRIRISSVEPGDFSLDWLELWQDKRLCAHLHVPLQSGSARVLQAMRRKYTPTAFLAMIDAARCAIDNLAVTTDVITGFPGETQGDFEDGFRLIESCEFDGMHVFPYSRRPGTAAAALGDTVSEADKKQRAAQLREIGEAGRRRHIDRNLGHRHEVVWEDWKDGVWRGTTGNNIRVHSCDAHLRTHGVDDRVLTSSYATGAWGELPASDRTEIPLRMV